MYVYAKWNYILLKCALEWPPISGPVFGLVIGYINYYPIIIYKLAWYDMTYAITASQNTTCMYSLYTVYILTEDTGSNYVSIYYHDNIAHKKGYWEDNYKN